MKKSGKRTLVIGIMLIIAFAVWTILIQMVDVQQVGLNGTDIGLATFNCWFHKLTGTNMPLYIITDWLGIVPLVITSKYFEIYNTNIESLCYNICERNLYE